MSLKSISSTINIIQYKSIDYGTRRTRYWYAIETEYLDDGWIRDSVIFRAYRTPENNTEPVYGYSFKAIYGWHNTLQIDLVPQTSDASRWMLSGVKFYAYNTSMGSEKLRPIHRYWNDPNIQPSSDDGFGRTYKLTIDMESEQSEWTFDKIVFYGLLPKK